MIAVFDIGNSYTKFVVFDSDDKIFNHQKFMTKSLPIKLISNLLVTNKISKVVIGSVVLNKSKEIIELSKLLDIETLNISKKHFWNSGFKTLCSKKEIGLDILSLSFFLAKTNKEFLAISFGTLTFACLYYNNSLNGVSIAPNFNLNNYEEFSNVSLINDVKIKLNKNIGFGQNTNAAISSGVIHYYSGFIESLYKSAASYININEIYITGGNSFIIQKMNFNFDINIDEFLVAKGYYFIHKKTI